MIFVKTSCTCIAGRFGIVQSKGCHNAYKISIFKLLKLFQLKTYIYIYIYIYGLKILEDFIQC